MSGLTQHYQARPGRGNVAAIDRRYFSISSCGHSAPGTGITMLRGVEGAWPGPRLSGSYTYSFTSHRCFPYIHQSVFDIFFYVS